MAKVSNAIEIVSGANLVADIGGTHCNLGLVFPDRQGVQYIQKLKVADFQDVVAAVNSYLTAISIQNKLPSLRVRKACFAAATLIDGDQIEFTNSPWSFSIERAQVALNLDHLLVLNDFAALAMSLPSLSSDDLSMISSHGYDAIKQEGTLAVVGPGTGLGVAGLVKATSQWVPLSSEGGHTSLSASNAFEWDLIKLVQTRHEHVSAERLLSGMGMPLLYQSIAQLNGAEVSQLTSAEIIARGLAKTDVIADQTIDVFCAMLGGFCGNVVLTLGATAGLFVGGGIIPRLGERFFESSFRQRFEAKGRFAALLTTVPLALITHPYPALNGCALAINQYSYKEH